MWLNWFVNFLSVSRANCKFSWTITGLEVLFPCSYQLLCMLLCCYAEDFWERKDVNFMLIYCQINFQKMKDEKNSKLRCLVKNIKPKFQFFRALQGTSTQQDSSEAPTSKKKGFQRQVLLLPPPVTHPGPATYLGPICIAKPINVCKNLIIYLHSTALDSAPARTVKSAAKCPAEKYAT